MLTNKYIEANQQVKLYATARPFSLQKKVSTLIQELPSQKGIYVHGTQWSERGYLWSTKDREKLMHKYKQHEWLPAIDGWQSSPMFVNEIVYEDTQSCKTIIQLYGQLISFSSKKETSSSIVRKPKMACM